MAVDMFLKLDGIEGEAVDGTHGKEIAILSFSWGMTQSATTHSGPGGGSGKVNVQDLTVVKRVDKSTPTLLAACATGRHVKKGTLTVRKAGGDKAVEYIKLDIQDIIVSSVSASAHADSNDELSESVTLNFSYYKYTYTGQGAGGLKDKSVESDFWIAGNIPGPPK